MIYCVEDEKNIRELLIYTLETTGFSARGMANSKELKDALKEENEIPKDGVITQEQMESIAGVKGNYKFNGETSDSQANLNLCLLVFPTLEGKGMVSCPLEVCS